MANFQWERLLMSLGRGRRRWTGACGATIAYALERQAFGRPIGSFQAIRHKVAGMATKLEAGPGDELRGAAAARRAARTRWPR